MKQILCNKYEVQKTIAEGGMGVVYLVKDLHLDKPAAVKVSKNAKSESERAYILKEVEVLKKLSHPSLPAVIDFFQEGENICLVMEYIEGITLKEHLARSGRVQLHQAVRWAVELTRTLGYLHSRNPPVIYRDLKPANIMIQADGTIRLGDFGAAFAGAYGQEGEQLLVGTPGYGAPEQWQSAGAGKESDIYALGAVLHEMLTGISPQSRFMERRPVREYDKSIPRELEKVIGVCTRRNPSERYRSMEQLREALLNCGRKKWGQQLRFFIRRGVGRLLVLAAVLRTIFPFLQGVKAADFPFPCLEIPLFYFGAAFAYRALFLRNMRERKVRVRQEKSVFLTQKKFPGIYVACIFALFLSAAAAAGKSASAREDSGKLWVEMRDDEGRKMLLREGTVYRTDKRIRFDIPAQDMPEGELALWLMARDEKGAVYESRVFLIEKEN